MNITNPPDDNFYVMDPHSKKLFPTYRSSSMNVTGVSNQITPSSSSVTTITPHGPYVRSLPTSPEIHSLINGRMVSTAVPYSRDNKINEASSKQSLNSILSKPENESVEDFSNQIISSIENANTTRLRYITDFISQLEKYFFNMEIRNED